MKREERTYLNRIRKDVVVGATINVHVPVRFSSEGKQAIHDVLTIEKHMMAFCIYWNDISDENAIYYIPASGTVISETNISDIFPTLPDYSDRNWLGKKRNNNPDPEGPDYETETETEDETMKNNESTFSRVSSIKKQGNGLFRLSMLDSDGKVSFQQDYKTMRGAKQAEKYYLKHPEKAVKKGYDVKRLFEMVNDAIETDRSAFHEPRDNSKLQGIPAHNLIPGKTCSPAACAHCMQDGCYAVKNALCHGYNIETNYCLRAWIENTALAFNHPYKLEKLLDEWLTANKPELFRIHSSGDFFSVKYARVWYRLAEKHQETRFLAFTKQFDIVRAVPFYKLPNFELVLSGWTGIVIPEDLRKYYRCAWCNDGTETRIPADAIHCPGDCNSCRACWFLSRIGKDSYFDKH